MWASLIFPPLGKGGCTKSDEFSEKFLTAFWPSSPPPGGDLGVPLLSPLRTTWLFDNWLWWNICVGFVKFYQLYNVLAPSVPCITMMRAAVNSGEKWDKILQQWVVALPSTVLKHGFIFLGPRGPLVEPSMFRPVPSTRPQQFFLSS